MQKKQRGKDMIIKIMVVILLLTIAVFTDLKRNKIDNRLILIGYGLAFLFSYREGGWSFCIDSLKYAVLIVVLLIGLFVLKGIGGGDIKLLSLIAAFFPKIAISVMLTSFLAGGIIIFCFMLYRGIRGKMIYKRGEIIHFSIPIAMAFLIQITKEVL